MLGWLLKRWHRHDWHAVETMDSNKARTDLKREIWEANGGKGAPPAPSPPCDEMELTLRVCLSCGEIDDGIQSYKDGLKSTAKEILRRDKQAEEILKSRK